MNLASQLSMAKEEQVIPATALANIIEKVLSMALTLGPVTRLMTRSLYTTYAECWHQELLITQEALEVATTHREIQCSKHLGRTIGSPNCLLRC